MKKLILFLAFLWEQFAAGKEFMVISCLPWMGKDDSVLGTRVETVITKDETDYGDPDVTNRYEKVVFKVPKPDLKVPVNSIVVPVNPTAKVWGEYRNQLSVQADDVRVVNQGGGK